MATPRMRRINEVLREVVGAAIAELSDPRIGFVTVTSVETSPDLRAAKVFVDIARHRFDVEAGRQSHPADILLAVDEAAALGQPVQIGNGHAIAVAVCTGTPSLSAMNW